MKTEMTPPSSDAILGLFGGGIMGAVVSYMHDKIKAAVTESQVKELIRRVDILSDDVKELNRYLRNGWHEKGH